jgi:hypothetical protein
MMELTEILVHHLFYHRNSYLISSFGETQLRVLELISTLTNIRLRSV